MFWIFLKFQFFHGKNVNFQKFQGHFLNGDGGCDQRENGDYWKFLYLFFLFLFSLQILLHLWFSMKFFLSLRFPKKRVNIIQVMITTFESFQSRFSRTDSLSDTFSIKKVNSKIRKSSIVLFMEIMNTYCLSLWNNKFRVFFFRPQ